MRLSSPIFTLLAAETPAPLAWWSVLLLTAIASVLLVGFFQDARGRASVASVVAVVAHVGLFALMTTDLAVYGCSPRTPAPDERIVFEVADLPPEPEPEPERPSPSPNPSPSSHPSPPLRHRR